MLYLFLGLYILSAVVVWWHIVEKNTLETLIGVFLTLMPVINTLAAAVLLAHEIEMIKIKKFLAERQASWLNR